MLKLLIVDDEKRTRDGLRHCIPWKDCGYGEVREADDGATALEIIREYEPDIILSDVLMPKMTGIDMAKRVQTKLPRCKFVFISGYSDKEYLKNAIQPKAFNYIEKPINVPELSACMREVALACEHEQRKLKSDAETIARLKTSVELLRSNCALHLAERQPQPGTIRRMLDASGLALPISGSYVSAVLELDGDEKVSLGYTPERLSVLYETICGRLSTDVAAFAAGIKDGRQLIVHVLLAGSLSREKLRSVMEHEAHLFSTTSGESQIQLNIGVGREVKSLESVHLSYESALLSVRQARFLGTRHVNVHEFKLAALTTREGPDWIDFNLFARMMECNDPAVFPYLEQMVKEIRLHEDIRIDHVRMLFYKLLLSLYQEAKNKFLGRYMEERKEESLWHQVTDMNTLDRLFQFLVSEIREFFAAIHNLGSTSRVVHDVMQYIRHHYRNGKLTIGDIANELSLTPAYLCQLFKKDTGQTINDYCNAYKIEKAKQLLTDRGIKLLEVASETGYNDVKYFTRTFKRITGVTPSEYRESISK